VVRSLGPAFSIRRGGHIPESECPARGCPGGKRRSDRVRFRFRLSVLSLLSDARNVDALACGGHLVDLSDRVRYVSCRSRVRLVGLAELGHVVHDGAAAALVKLALILLLLEDLPDRNLPSLPRAAPVGELLEAPRAALELSVFDQLEGVEDVALDPLLVFQDEPGSVHLVIRVIGEVQNRSDHDDLVEGNGFLPPRGCRRFVLLLLLFVAGSDVDDLVERDGLSRSGRAVQRRRRRIVVVATAAAAAAVTAVVLRLQVLGWFLLFRVR